MAKNIGILLVIFLLASGCKQVMKIGGYGQHYQKHNDYASLSKVVQLMDLGVDSSYVRNILGEPINMGFDFRYLIDSTSQKGCAVGAVFHINEYGKVDQKWIDEICE